MIVKGCRSTLYLEQVLWFHTGRPLNISNARMPTDHASSASVACTQPWPAAHKDQVDFPCTVKNQGEVHCHEITRYRDVLRGAGSPFGCVVRQVAQAGIRIASREL